ncbi:class I SAM-dependent methyltransferase [Rhodoplanes sp. SY1]|uniref:class I SAM-dependent methyltransferase n=1 Tax=Rhodoplanes sp. SY1 TaxID=3166646 RepID=UPI0038B51D4E
MTPICNLCGSTEWIDMNGRVGVRCRSCGSVERTRAVKLVMDHLGIPKPGMRVLHLAPEKGLSTLFSAVCGDGYDPVDLDPRRYLHTRTRKFDIISDASTLPDNHYDIILHLHVLEHIPCNLAHAIYHLYRALKPDGRHIFCIPLMSGHYDECFAPLSNEMRTLRFGQFDHVRRFGVEDFDHHIGLLLNLDKDYSLYNTHSRDQLDACNIPVKERSGLNGSTIFVTSKTDYRLR